MTLLLFVRSFVDCLAMAASGATNAAAFTAGRGPGGRLAADARLRFAPCHRRFTPPTASRALSRNILIALPFLLPADDDFSAARQWLAAPPLQFLIGQRIAGGDLAPAWKSALTC